MDSCQLGQITPKIFGLLFQQILGEYLYLFGTISYCFIPPILLKLVVYIQKLILLMFFVFPQLYDNFTPIVILMRRRHLNNTTFFLMFPERVILKRENNSTYNKLDNNLQHMSRAFVTSSLFSTPHHYNIGFYKPELDDPRQCETYFTPNICSQSTNRTRTSKKT